MPAPRTLFTLVLTLLFPSCTYWQTTTTPLPELTESNMPPSLIRVTTVCDEVIDLKGPRVHNDTLIGGSGPDENWVYVAIKDITSVAIKKKVCSARQVRWC